MVVLVTAQPVLPGAKNFIRALLEAAAAREVTVTTVVQNYNPRRTSAVLGTQEKVLYGKGFILDELCGKRYAISPRSFYQVNPAQTAVLYGLAVDAAHLTGKETVLDAYCGIGTIGLTAADRCKQVLGVEVNRDAVQDAIGNARHNGVRNARFVAADATAWMLDAAQQGLKADVVFMDPPREGSTPQFLQSLARLSPRRVVYVSCNPETLARDLAQLTALGYRVQKLPPWICSRIRSMSRQYVHCPKWKREWQMSGCRTICRRTAEGKRKHFRSGSFGWTIFYGKQNSTAALHPFAGEGGGAVFCSGAGSVALPEHQAKAHKQQKAGDPDGAHPPQGDQTAAQAGAQGKQTDDAKVVQGLVQGARGADLAVRQHRASIPLRQVSDAHGAGKSIAVHFAGKSAPA